MGAGIHELVAGWCARTPDAPAVTVAGGGVSLTYRQLWDRSGALAADLRDRGVQPGEVVAAAMGRTVDLVVAILGIVRAGGAYLALDGQAPPDRIAEILADASVRHVLESTSGTSDTGSPEVPVAGDGPCYVISTSGSTGRPKGVVIPHRAVTHLVRDPVWCELAPGDRAAAASNPAFDLFTFEVWGPLAAGGTVVVFPDLAAVGLDRYVRLIQTERLAFMGFPTSVFHLIARERPGALGDLGTVLFGGEQPDPALIRRVLTAGPPGRMVNVYGPTETTTLVSYHECTLRSVPEGARVPIGVALPYAGLSIVDESLRPVAPGETGELCVTGPGVGLGYLARPELTAERFVPTPAGTMYRTGDLVRARPDGAFELIGRRDRQVKLRGFRVELDEIELAATATGLLDTAIVAKVGDGESASLVGFVVPEDADTVELQARLARRLPAYMVPGRWIRLPELPLGRTGKIDRISLMALVERTGAGTPAAAEGPLDDVWRELLKVSAVSAGDNFIELGGNSLLAVRAAARIRERLAVEVEPADVLLAETLGDLADRLLGGRT